MADEAEEPVQVGETFGGWPNLEEAEEALPVQTEPIPVEVAAVAAEAAPPETPWEKVAEEAKNLLQEAEDAMKGGSSSGT